MGEATETGSLEVDLATTVTAAAYDEAVARTRDIDLFCSSSHWIAPAHAAFHATCATRIRALDHGFLALAAGRSEGLGRYLAPLEAMWGLACPVIGEDARKVGTEAARYLLSERHTWDVLWLGGIARQSELFSTLVRELKRDVTLRVGPTTVRYRASLEGGFDGWLGRRSALFRKRIRQALRSVEFAGIRFEWLGPTLPRDADGAALFERIHAVETRSWKGQEGTGFVTGDMRAFYAAMVPRLVAAGALRVLFAKRGDEDVAVCFGGVFEGTYRGLQNSFDDRFRDLSLGNVMQGETIRRLGHEGIALYDLGSEMDYKQRFAEEAFETMTLLGVRGR